MWSKYFCMVLVVVGAIAQANEPPKICLLRAPRSGSHWFFYCCNTLFEKNILKESTERLDRYPYKMGGDIYIAHNPYDLKLSENAPNNFASGSEDFLILLVRNYREALLREYGSAEAVTNEILCQASFNEQPLQKEWVFSLRMNHYFHNFRVYELWNPDKRLLIYYEDLLQNPLQVLLQLADLFGETGKDNQILEFVENFDEHVEKSLAIYEKTYQSNTRGKSPLYHSKRAGLEKCLALDQLIMEHFPEFVERYLSPYLIDINDDEWKSKKG